MEVHPHTHTPHKKWVHYIYEFLMLFLAVTLGFYAENLRENIKNKEEIRINMRSLLSDLRADVALFDSVLERNEYGCTMADSLIKLLHNNNSNSSDIYFAARSVTANFGYFYTNAKSFEQMKSAGLLKMVQPRSLSDSISAYYNSFQWLASQTELTRLKVDAIHKGNTDLFDSYIFQQMMQISYVIYNTHHVMINHPEGNPPLLSRDPGKLNSVMMNYHYYYTTAKFYDRTAASIKQLALHLIEEIKKQYSFD